MAILGKSHLSLCPAAARKAVLWIPEEDAMGKASALRMEKLVESYDAQAEFFDTFFFFLIYAVTFLHQGHGGGSTMRRLDVKRTMKCLLVDQMALANTS